MSTFTTSYYYVCIIYNGLCTIAEFSKNKTSNLLVGEYGIRAYIRKYACAKGSPSFSEMYVRTYTYIRTRVLSGGNPGYGSPPKQKGSPTPK